MGTCLTFQEAEIRAIEADIELLKKGKLTMQAEDESPQLQALRTQNSKLKYQRMHLQRVIARFILHSLLKNCLI